MIQLTAASIRYGEKVLFEDLNWLVTPQARIGIVGANGSGKTTLLKILVGLETLDHGRITQQNNLRIGYLPQDGLSLSGRTVFDECVAVFDEVLALESEQTELTEKMSSLDPESTEYSAVAKRYQWVHDRYHALEGYSKEAQVAAVLAGLGFTKQDWNRKTDEFSGGWQMRIALAKLLLEKPNLLLLDEPTNHLDLETRNWLEGYLDKYPFAFILVSHDRYFIDATVKRIVEIWNQTVHFYAGNYSRYESLRQQRIEQVQAAYKNQQDQIRHLESFINRFRYKATKAVQVQSRVKRLAKIERIELPEEESTVHFRFPQPKASGRIVMEFQHVAKAYGPQEVFSDLSFIIERRDRIALIGPNGAGKSTLIRLLAGDEPLTRGQRIVGHNAEVDYFAQDQYKELDPNVSMFDDLAGLAARSGDSELRSLLGCFLFSGDDVFKTISVLSGGERNRYALARMLVKPSNFLLLDEPTNHLDLRAKEVLLRSLLDFSGTIVFVSHDRYFIDKLATKVFSVGDGGIEIFPGNYEDYLWQTSRHRELAQQQRATANESLKPPAGEVRHGENSTNSRKKAARMNPMQAERLRGQVAELEGEISGLESEVAELQLRLSESYKDHQRTAEITVRMEQCRELIQAREQVWQELTAKLEANA